MTEKNEAAERLHARYCTAKRRGPHHDCPFWLFADDALAAERRATVERIRERLDEIDIRYDNVDAILDEEAAR